jgi:4'-phosphopantetheinyl transferase
MMDSHSAPLLALPSDQVHVWLVADDDIDDRLLAHYRQHCLNGQELLREKRFYFEKHRKQFVITRALVRSVLSRYANIAPSAWQFSKNDYGRPEICNGNAASDALSFNLSHTEGMVMLAVSCKQPLGIDVENTHVRPAPLDIADHYFSPHEAKALSALPIPLQAERFFQYWTLKESYIKAEGKGLSIPLAQFSLNFLSDTGVAIAFHTDEDKNPLHWHFCLFRPSPHTIASVCVNRGNGNRPQIIGRKAIPFGSDQPFTCQILRQTAV